MPLQMHNLSLFFCCFSVFEYELWYYLRGQVTPAVPPPARGWQREQQPVAEVEKLLGELKDRLNFSRRGTRCGQ